MFPKDSHVRAMVARRVGSGWILGSYRIDGLVIWWVHNVAELLGGGG